MSRGLWCCAPASASSPIPASPATTAAASSSLALLASAYAATPQTAHRAPQRENVAPSGGLALVAHRSDGSVSAPLPYVR